MTGVLATGYVQVHWLERVPKVAHCFASSHSLDEEVHICIQPWSRKRSNYLCFLLPSKACHQVAGPVAILPIESTGNLYRPKSLHVKKGVQGWEY